MKKILVIDKFDLDLIFIYLNAFFTIQNLSLSFESIYIKLVELTLVKKNPCLLYVGNRSNPDCFNTVMNVMRDQTRLVLRYGS